MKDISFYFKPIVIAEQEGTNEQLSNVVDRHTEHHFPELNQKGIALIYVPEFRTSEIVPETNTPLYLEQFYKLFKGVHWDFKLYDLGTIHPGNSIDDTFHALANAIETLVQQKIVPIVIGGSQDLTFANYQAYEKLEQLVNICTVDSKLDLGDIESPLCNRFWLNKLITHKPCFLFNVSNLGAQSHYIAPSEIELFDQLYFDILRFGQISNNLTLCEPILRNSDMVSFDLNCIRASEISGKHYQSPNGFSAQEICRIARYTGISDKVTSIGIYNYFSDGLAQAGHELLAQIIWYMIEGYANRKGDFPIGSKNNYTKYRVSMDGEHQELIFLKSEKSSRWWMEVPYPSIKGQKYERHHLVPCTYTEYEEAMKGNIPDLWWRTFLKLG